MAFALGAFAEDEQVTYINRVGFEGNSYPTNNPDIAWSSIEEPLAGSYSNSKLWSTESQESVGQVLEYGSASEKYSYAGTAALVQDGPGDKYLSLDSSSETLYRTFASEMAAFTPNGDVVIDTLVQFTSPTESIAVPALDEGVKFAVSLCTPEEGGATNLYVTAASGAETEDSNYYDATNYCLNVSVDSAQ